MKKIKIFSILLNKFLCTYIFSSNVNSQTILRYAVSTLWKKKKKEFIRPHMRYIIKYTVGIISET